MVCVPPTLHALLREDTTLTTVPFVVPVTVPSLAMTSRRVIVPVPDSPRVHPPPTHVKVPVIGPVRVRVTGGGVVGVLDDVGGVDGGVLALPPPLAAATPTPAAAAPPVMAMIAPYDSPPLFGALVAAPPRPGAAPGVPEDPPRAGAAAGDACGAVATTPTRETRTRKT